MKIKVTLRFPAMEVSEVIEIGYVKNSNLNEKQGKIVDRIVADNLWPKMRDNIDKVQPKVILKTK